MMGVNTDDGRGNITAYASSGQQAGPAARPRLLGLLAGREPDESSFACGGSGTTFPGQFTDFGANFTPDPGPDAVSGTADDEPKVDINPMPAFNNTLTGNDFRGFATADQYNFGPLNHYLRPERRYSLGAMGHYELAPFADVYTQLMFTDVRVGRADRPGRQLLRHLDDQLRQPVPVGDSKRRRSVAVLRTAGGRSINPAPDCRSWLIRTSCRCTSAVVTWKAVVASRLPQHFVPWLDRHARRHRRRLGIRRQHAVLAHLGNGRDVQLLRRSRRSQRALDVVDVGRRADRPRVPLGRRRHGPELRPVQRVCHRRHHAGSAGIHFRLPACRSARSIRT